MLLLHWPLCNSVCILWPVLDFGICIGLTYSMGHVHKVISVVCIIDNVNVSIKFIESSD